MLGDYAGACKAIEDRLKGAWDQTPIVFDDGRTPDVIGPDRRLQPWVLCEIETYDSRIRSIGGAGMRVTVDAGRINLTLFSPRAEVDADRDSRRDMAVQLANIFRTAVFYKVLPGVYVRTWTPVIGPGGKARSENPSGNWWATTIATPFEFYHRA
jgi:hypothetical protein